MARKTRSFDSNDNSQAIEDMSVEHTLSMTDGARGLHSVNHGAGIGAHGGRMMSDGMPSPGNANAALQISDPRLSTPVSPRGAALMDDTTTMNDETQGDATMGLGLNDNHHGGMMGDDDERDEMVDVNELGMNEDGDGMYNEKNQNGYDNSDMEDYDFMVGDVLCWFKPSKVQGLKDFCSRTKDWLILNKEQIMSSITGEWIFRPSRRLWAQQASGATSIRPDVWVGPQRKANTLKADKSWVSVYTKLVHKECRALSHASIIINTQSKLSPLILPPLLCQLG